MVEREILCGEEACKPRSAWRMWKDCEIVVVAGGVAGEMFGGAWEPGRYP